MHDCTSSCAHIVTTGARAGSLYVHGSCQELSWEHARHCMKRVICHAVSFKSQQVKCIGYVTDDFADWLNQGRIITISGDTQRQKPS